MYIYSYMSHVFKSRVGLQACLTCGKKDIILTLNAAIQSYSATVSLHYWDQS